MPEHFDFAATRPFARVVTGVRQYLDDGPLMFPSHGTRTPVAELDEIVKRLMKKERVAFVPHNKSSVPTRHGLYAIHAKDPDQTCLHAGTIIRFNSTASITVFPPPLCADREWHEIREATIVSRDGTEAQIMDDLRRYRVG